MLRRKSGRNWPAQGQKPTRNLRSYVSMSWDLIVRSATLQRTCFSSSSEAQPLLFRLRGAFYSMGRALRRGKGGRGGAESGEGGFIGAGGMEDKAPLRSDGDAPRSRALTETSTSLLTLSPSFDALDMSYSTTNFTLAANASEQNSFLFLLFSACTGTGANVALYPQ